MSRSVRLPFTQKYSFFVKGTVTGDSEIPPPVLPIAEGNGRTQGK